MGKFTIKDFGKIVRPKTLLEAYILCKHENFDADSWWHKVRTNTILSRTFKKDMISGTYGMDFRKLFATLFRDTFVCQINSFIVFHRGIYKLVTSPEEVEPLNDNSRIVVCAVGVKFFNQFDPKTNTTSNPWKITEDKQILWFFRPKNLISIDIVQQYENAEVGDLVIYTKTHGLISKITYSKIKAWWAKTSWTRKKVTVLSGQNSKPHKLSIDRPYELVKQNKE